MKKYRAWCSCSWHGEFKSERMAHSARRRHSCELWERRRARRLAVALRRASLDRRRRAYGEVAYVDARPAAAHVRACMARGLGWKRVAAAAGLDASAVYPLLYGRRDRNGGAPRTKARSATVAAILAVPLPELGDLAAGRRVPSVGTRRRLQALCAIGWSISRVAERSGIDRQALDGALGGRQVMAATARAVVAIYDELWDQVPTARNGYERGAIDRARRRALAAGWVPPLAWDDDAIDNPKSRPRVARPKEVA